MCRLALINKEGINHLEQTIGINNLFNHLEKSLGGHGNGYCMILNNCKVRIKKGVNLSNEDITADILKYYNSINWIMYHTRYASMGVINNENCHPFKDKNNNVLMMNGTEHGVKNFITGTKTDTETILNLCDIFNVNIKEGTKRFNSVFIGYNKGKVFANKNNGSLEYLHYSKNSIILSSEFLPEQYKNNNIYISPAHWQEGQKIDITKLINVYNKKQMSANYYSYFNNEYTEYKKYNFLK